MPHKICKMAEQTGIKIYKDDFNIE